MRSALIALVALLSGFWGVGVAQADVDGIRTALLPDDQVMIGIGWGVYEENCASCHGVNLEGQTAVDNPDPEDDSWIPAPAHDDSGHTWHHPDDQLFDTVKYGFADALDDPDYPMWMPAYDGILNDEEIIAVLSFIKSTWTEDTQKIHDQKNALDARFWQPFVR